MKQSETARYIDANKIEYNFGSVYQGKDKYGFKGYVWANIAYKSSINAIPTADVIPRSEVKELARENESLAKTVNEASELIHKLRNQVEKAKAEVARGIFEEIERVIGERYENYAFDNLEIEGVEQEAIIAFADTMKRNFSELKKKYTEGKE